MTRIRSRRRVAVMGAAACDYHGFLCVFRDDPTVEVVAFIAALSGIAAQPFPASLGGPRYPDGIPILNEELLEQLIAQRAIDEVVLCGGEHSHADVLGRAARVLATGASFVLLGPARTMLRAPQPVIAVSPLCEHAAAVRVAGWIASSLRESALRTTALRAHPGIDFRDVLASAASDSDVLLWEAESGDFPFLKPDLHIVLVDAAGGAAPCRWHTSEALLRMADVVLIVGGDTIGPAHREALVTTVQDLNPAAPCVLGGSLPGGAYRDIGHPGLRGELQQFLRGQGLVRSLPATD